MIGLNLHLLFLFVSLTCVQLGRCSFLPQPPQQAAVVSVPGNGNFYQSRSIESDKKIRDMILKNGGKAALDNFMVSKSLLLVAHPVKLSGGLEGQAQLNGAIRKIDYEANMETDADVPQTENKENDSPVRTKRSVSSSGSGRRVSISTNGITIRAYNHDSNTNLGVSIINNKVMVGGKVVKDDTTEKLDKATYQKSADGTLWHTNVKVGEPMSQAEIDAFEKEWAQYEKEQAERRRQREAERRQRDEERERQRQQREEERRQRDEERERQRKQREEERRIREEERAERRGRRNRA